MWSMQFTGPLQGRTRPRHDTREEPATYLALASLLIAVVAIGLAAVTYGLGAIPPAAIATLLGRRARHELREETPPATRRLAALAHGTSVTALAFSLIALALLLIDLARVGEVANRLVERAR